ncbi:nuclease-related domain-containing protein [Planococcus shenhongbingii]|uniref:Nuclease-related domain-containing protein n=1 Tax=Planococcus shenhongbingii TaxID=3058398 RepID=A0ABT8NDL6_9BACL|nr:nuclease-related domain-containing protein [Planococcus sp. N017]MDN7245946.1 nuclease-related domain-containing protein [Planococcus sp. N017]
MKLSRVEALQGAIRRLKMGSPDHLFLEKELFNTEAGIRGEQRLRKKFIEFYFPEGYEIIWNNCLSLNQWPVQIDGLLLTEKVAIIIESKNISGELYFDNDTREFYRVDATGLKTVMDNPSIQVEKHIRFMKAWFAAHSIQLPVDGLLVFTSKQAELKTLPQNIRTCRHHHMIELLFKIIKEYKPPTNLRSSLEYTKNLIESNQTPFVQKPILVQYSIKTELLARGIFCEHCDTPTVVKHLRSWRCLQCGLVDNHSPVRAILEYISLFGGPISNQNIRDFTGIKDRHAVKRLLTLNDFEKTGQKRHSKYSLK